MEPTSIRSYFVLNVKKRGIVSEKIAMQIKATKVSRGKRYKAESSNITYEIWYDEDMAGINNCKPEES
jgi:hypothetical protein